MGEKKHGGEQDRQKSPPGTVHWEGEGRGIFSTFIEGSSKKEIKTYRGTTRQEN